MKIIDEKGRLFGKLNLIDLLVIILLIAAVAADLAVTIEGRGQFTGNVYKVGAQEVRVGYEYIVKTSEFELTGIITAMTVAE